MKNRNITFTAIALVALGAFGLAPMAQAVSPGPTQRGGYNDVANQRESEQFHPGMAARLASRIILLVLDSSARSPISVSSFHGCATDGRKSLLASAAWEFQGEAISSQLRCAWIEPNWAG